MLTTQQIINKYNNNTDNINKNNKNDLILTIILS